MKVAIVCHQETGAIRRYFRAGLVAIASVMLIACASGPRTNGTSVQREAGRAGELPGQPGRMSGQAPAGATDNAAGRQAAESRQGMPMNLTAAQGANIDALLALTRELILLAPDVARIRWNAKAPPEDPAAETATVNAAVAQAALLNADPELFRAFFRAQLEASKFVQTELHKQWREAHLGNITLMRTPAQVQAASDDITPRLLQALAKAAPALKATGARSLLETRAAEIMPTRSALSDPTRAIAIRPLLERAAQ